MIPQTLELKLCELLTSLFCFLKQRVLNVDYYDVIGSEILKSAFESGLSLTNACSTVFCVAMKSIFRVWLPGFHGSYLDNRFHHGARDCRVSKSILFHKSRCLFLEFLCSTFIATLWYHLFDLCLQHWHRVHDLRQRKVRWWLGEFCSPIFPTFDCILRVQFSHSELDLY